MPFEAPSSLPPGHRNFLEALVRRLPSDERLVGVAAGGSYLTDAMDPYSDLDLVVAVEPSAFGQVMEDRKQIAATLGPLLASFTGEHVGEPRLLICLYGEPLLHVDLKFVALGDAAQRVEDPAILWERGSRFSEALRGGRAEYPMPDPTWIEDRFWIWIHYAVTKIGRGELFEALDFLAFLRTFVLGPLAAVRAGARPTGVRRLEVVDPEFARELQQTLARHDARDCLRAVDACAELYRDLRAHANAVEPQAEAEAAAMGYLRRIGAKLGDAET
ncbi:MAG: nucleotidyltransferase domain-containing protein [Acidobacteriota bacterium]